MDQKEISSLLQNQWMGFNSNLGALYTFFENLSETADKLDREKKRQFAVGLASIFRENTEEIEKEVFEYVPSIDDLDVFPDFREDESVREIVKILQANDFKERMLVWENKHPHKSYKLARLIFSLFGNPPMSGIILRKSMLITLVTFLEVLIQSLYINHFLVQGLTRSEATDRSEKLMKGNWDKKLKNLNQTGISTTISSRYREEILDIVRLRNLLVHNDGVVDNEYLKRSKQSSQNGLKLGNILIVSTNRLQQALNIIFVYGFLLCQSHWRLHDNNEKSQNGKIDQLFLDSFDTKRYGLILELSNAVKVLELPENINQRILVDQAIAFRELKKFNEVEAIVSELKTSPHDWQIDIAISALSSDYKTLQSQFIKAQVKYDIRKVVHWPLFDPIKNELWFKKASTINRNRVDLSRTRRR